MGTPYPLEKKNQILGRIISKEITVEQAHSETNKLSVIDVGSRMYLVAIVRVFQAMMASSG